MTTTIGNRIKETTNTAGATDPFTLLGAAAGYQAFSDEISTNDYTFYICIDGDEWEAGIGQLTNSTTLSRDTILGSTNGGAKVDFTGNTKSIFCDVPAEHLLFLNKDGLLDNASGFRKSLVLADISTMKAETGVVDGEAVFVLSNGTDDDMSAGLYEYRSASAATESLPDVATATGMGAGRWHRIDASQKRGKLLAYSAEPTGASAGMYAYSDGTASTNNFGSEGKGLYVYTGSKWILATRETKSGAGSPVGVLLPDFIGQIYKNTSDSTLFMSSGLTSSDWILVSNDKLTATLDANSNKIANASRIDFISLGAEPGDASEGMIAYSDGTPSTGQFGQSGEGLYIHNGTQWAPVSQTVLADNSVSLAKLADIPTARIIGRNTAGSGDPELLDEATFKALFNLEIGTDVQAYDADLADWAGKAAPTGDAVGTSDTQTLTNKTITAPVLTLSGASNPTPTVDGEIWWDTDSDKLVIGDGASQVTISADTFVLSRANHSGTQLMSTISNAGALAVLDTVGTGQIDANAVTLGKIQTITNNRVLGNVSGGTAVPVELTGAQVKALMSIAAGDVSGLGALATLSTVGTAQIDANAVTLAKMATISDGRILGNNIGGAGVPLELTAAQVKTMLAISDSDVSGLGALATVSTVGTSEIDDDAVTIAKLAGATIGSILYWDASGNPQILAPGTNGQFLQTQGAGSIPIWSSAGAGDVSQDGTSADDQIAVYTGDGAIEGTSNLTYDGSILSITGDLTVSNIGIGMADPAEALEINGSSTIANSGDATAGHRLNAYYDAGYKATLTGYGAQTVFNRTTGKWYLAISSNSVAPDTALSMQNVMTISTGGAVELNAGPLFLAEQAAADADAAGYGQLWIKNDTPNKLMFTDDAGTDYDLTAAGAGSATTSAEGLVELATTAEINTGTDAARVVTPDTLAASDFGIQYIELWCSGIGDDVATGDGAAYFHVPPAMNGMDLVYVHAEVITAGTTGTTDVQVNNVTQAADMLSTKITIDSTETGSDTAAAAAVIDTSNDDVATNDLIRVDVDSVSTTAPKGLLVTLGFRKP